MGRSTPRRRRAKQPSGRFPRGKRNVRNENFRYVNRFGNHAMTAFIGLLFTGYLLISRPHIHVTVSPETVTVLGGVLSGTAFGFFQTRRYRR